MIGRGKQPYKLVFTSKERPRQNHDIFLCIKLYAEAVNILDFAVETIHVYADGSVYSP